MFLGMEGVEGDVREWREGVEGGGDVYNLEKTRECWWFFSRFNSTDANFGMFFCVDYFLQMIKFRENKFLRLPIVYFLFVNWEKKKLILQNYWSCETKNNQYMYFIWAFKIQILELRLKQVSKKKIHVDAR